MIWTKIEREKIFYHFRILSFPYPLFSLTSRKPLPHHYASPDPSPPATPPIDQDAEAKLSQPSTRSSDERRQDRAELPRTKPLTQLPHAVSGQPTTAPDLLELVRTSRSFKLHRSGLEDARRPQIKDHELFWSWSSSCATTTVRRSHPPLGMISMDLG